MSMMITSFPFDVIQPLFIAVIILIAVIVMMIDFYFF